MWLTLRLSTELEHGPIPGLIRHVGLTSISLELGLFTGRFIDNDGSLQSFRTSPTFHAPPGGPLSTLRTQKSPSTIVMIQALKLILPLGKRKKDPEREKKKGPPIAHDFVIVSCLMYLPVYLKASGSLKYTTNALANVTN